MWADDDGSSSSSSSVPRASPTAARGGAAPRARDSPTAASSLPTLASVVSVVCGGLARLTLTSQWELEGVLLRAHPSLASFTLGPNARARAPLPGPREWVSPPPLAGVHAARSAPPGSLDIDAAAVLRVLLPECANLESAMRAVVSTAPKPRNKQTRRAAAIDADLGLTAVLAPYGYALTWGPPDIR